MSGVHAGAGAGQPASFFLEANRLRHHLVDWSERGAHGEPVLLLHGLQEHARAWDFVAPRLAATGRRVLALDWRGHGASEWIGRGGYYHFSDYVADLGLLVRALGGRVALVGHSMGGSAALLFAGTEPARVASLVCIEGLGPPDCEPAVAAERHAHWIEELEAAARPRAPRAGREPLTLERATRRLAERFPLWPPEVARHMALHGTRPAGAGAAAGERAWRFDPLHRTRSPQPYYVAQARSFWRRIACPVLYVEGTRSYISAAPIEIDARIGEIGAERATIEGAGHHPHLEYPAETARILVDFLGRHRTDPGREVSL